MADYGSFEQIEDSEIYTASSTPKKIEILGLKFDREAFAVIVLAFANVAVLMLICWYKRNREQRISILLEEQRAGFYRELATYGRLVMNEYEELHELNQQLTKAKGYDALPMVKHLVDHTTPHIPRRTSSVKKGKPVVAPPPRKAPAESNIVSKIKIGLQKATSIAQPSEADRPYFEAIDQLHKLRERPPARAATRSKQFLEANTAVLNAVPHDSFRDRALGVLLGSMVADSCASYFGRQNQPPTESKVEFCLKMQGGGAHSLAQGQIRNCELQLCLVWGLVDRNMNFDKDKVLDLKKTMEFYKGWMQSAPPAAFAFPDTVLRAFETLNNEEATLVEVLKESRSKNRRSTSSDSLLRLLPLAIWTSQVKNPYQVKKALSAEAAFVHQNKLVHSAIFIYFMALQCLLQNPRDGERGTKAYDYAYELSKQELARGVRPGDSVKEWLEVALTMSSASSETEEAYLLQNFNCIDQPDDIRHPFILSFYFLLTSKPGKDLDNLYKKCLRLVLLLGGDVAANAAIVMGMVGAFVGVRRLPSDMLGKALAFDCANDDPGALAHPREEFLSLMRHGLVNFESLISLRPMYELVIQQE